MTTNNTAMSAEEMERKAKEWTQVEFTKAHRYLQSKGFTAGKVIQTESRVLPPLLALWRIDAQADGRKVPVWVLTGDLPHDHLAVSAAASPREALRHISLQWQLKAANLEAGLKQNRIELGSRKTQQDFIDSLVQGAEHLYKLVEAKQLWPND